MHDEEFVKLRHWIDAEFTILHVQWAVLLGLLIDKRFVWWAVGAYIIFSLIYAAVKINYVESKHSGYLKIPRR